MENINLKPPTREAVRRNLKRMQNDKAPGIDGIKQKCGKQTSNGQYTSDTTS